MNLARLKKTKYDDDTVLSPEERAEIEAIKRENIWISLEDAEASFRVMDKLAAHD